MVSGTYLLGNQSLQSSGLKICVLTSTNKNNYTTKVLTTVVVSDVVESKHLATVKWGGNTSPVVRRLLSTTSSTNKNNPTAVVRTIEAVCC